MMFRITCRGKNASDRTLKNTNIIEREATLKMELKKNIGKYFKMFQISILPLECRNFSMLGTLRDSAEVIMDIDAVQDGFKELSRM